MKNSNKNIIKILYFLGNDRGLCMILENKGDMYQTLPESSKDEVFAIDKQTGDIKQNCEFERL